MANLYREMFDEVRASDRLKQEVRDMTNMTRRQKRRGKLPAAALIAAVLTVALAGTALAAAILPGTLRDLFTQRWTELTNQQMSEAHAASIDRLTQDVGVSAASGGVTVTLDSLTVGDSALWLLLKVDGDVPEGGDENPWPYYFENVDVNFAVNPDTESTVGGSCIEFLSAGVAEDGRLTMLLRYSATLTSRDSLTSGHEAKLQLEDLMFSGSVAAEGQWTLPFTLEAVEQESLILERAVVPAINHDEPGKEYTVELRDIRISATGVRFVQSTGDQVYYPSLKGVALADGAVVPMAGGGSRWTEEIGTGDWASDYYWDLPVDLSEVVGIQFGNQIFPIAAD